MTLTTVRAYSGKKSDIHDLVRAMGHISSPASGDKWHEENLIAIQAIFLSTKRNYNAFIEFETTPYCCTLKPRLHQALVAGQHVAVDIYVDGNMLLVLATCCPNVNAN